MSTPLDTDALWRLLREKGIVDLDTPPVDDAHAPWYLLAFTAVAAWLAALLLALGLGAVLAMTMDDFSTGTLVAVSLVVSGAATAMLRAAAGLFWQQAATALVFAGLMLLGIVLLFERELMGGLSTPAGNWLLALWSLGLYLAATPTLHRLVCGSGVAVGVVGALWRRDLLDSLFGGAAYLPASACLALAVGAAVLWVASRPLAADRRFVPLAWVFTMAASVLTWFTLVSPTPAEGMIVAYGLAVLPALFAAGLLWPPREAADRRFAVVLPAVLLLFAPIWLNAPGLGLAVAWLLAGFALAEPVLMGWAMFALAVGSVRYVYVLDLTLLQKAGTLLAAGAALLAVRLVWRAWRRRSQA